MKNIAILFTILSLALIISGCGGAQIRGDFSDGTWLNRNIAQHLEIPIELHLAKFSLGSEITDSYLVGEAKTGALNTKSEIVSDISIQDIFYNAFNDAFRNMGFVITDDADKADLKVSGEIQQFWVREHASGWTPEYAKAAVRYDIVFRDSNNNVFWAKSIDTEEKSSGLGAAFDATGSTLPTLKKALFKSIDIVVNDSNLQINLNQLIKNKKQ